MLASKRDLILTELAQGTGARIEAAVDFSGLRSGIKIWFGDLDERHGPVAELRIYGLKGHRVTLSFGNFSGQVLEQIMSAAPEDVQLARALVSSIRSEAGVTVTGQSLADWKVLNGAFRMEATMRNCENPFDDCAVILTCREIIVPMMAAMAELIGYDVIDMKDDEVAPAFEGAVMSATVRRRERNPRNRLLCIRLHGSRCYGCGADPEKTYGAAGAILEVHHLEPLSLLTEPRPYDPCTDLVPLCPNCHRAVHTRRPAPLNLDELHAILGMGHV